MKIRKRNVKITLKERLTIYFMLEYEMNDLRYMNENDKDGEETILAYTDMRYITDETRNINNQSERYEK